MLRSILGIALLVLAASVSAQGIDYTYLQGSFGRVDLDIPGFDLDGDGLGISGSYAIDDDFHVFGEYQSADLDIGGDFDLIEVGVGYHSSITPRMDVYANIGYIDLDTSGGGGDNGFEIGIGLRGPVSEAVELYGGLDYIDFDSFDSETRATAGFMLGLTDTFGVGLKASLWDDVNIFQINVRLYIQ